MWLGLQLFGRIQDSDALGLVGDGFNLVRFLLSFESTRCIDFLRERALDALQCPRLDLAVSQHLLLYVGTP